MQAVPTEYPEPASLPPVAGGAAEEAGGVLWAGSEGCVVAAGGGLLAAADVWVGWEPAGVVMKTPPGLQSKVS